MLTGDKGLTAEQIGLSCGMIDPTEEHVMMIDDNQISEDADVISKLKEIKERKKEKIKQDTRRRESWKHGSDPDADLQFEAWRISEVLADGRE